MIYTTTFTWAPRTPDALDDDFHRLDASIALAARETPGYVGEEAWSNAATGVVSTVYYWRTLGAVQALMDHPLHQQAKARHAEWFTRYRVVVAKVMRAYGPGDGLPGLVALDDA